MAKRPVTMSLRDEDLVLLDAFAAERRLTRGDAVGMLLESTTSPQKPSRVVEEPTFEKNESAGPIDPVELARAVKAEALKQALRMTEKRVGVQPVEVDGDGLTQVGDWEEPP